MCARALGFLLIPNNHGWCSVVEFLDEVRVLVIAIARGHAQVAMTCSLHHIQGRNTFLQHAIDTTITQ